MINGLKIGAGLLGVVAIFASVEFSTLSVLPTASAQNCGCGKPDCGGCLAGLGGRRVAGEVVFNANDPIVSTVYGEPVEHVASAVHGCQSCSSCLSCRSGKPTTQCDCQYCELKTKEIEVEKKRFVIEQKEVCIPEVRLPWKRCCPPKKSRVRTVNVLKSEKYKGKTCEYKWSVHEPEEYMEPEPAESMPVHQSEQTVSQEATSIYPDPSAETTGVLELSDPAKALEAVPRPPLEK